MIVTITTDASYHPNYKVGAFAFWIVSNEGKVLNSGALKSKIKNSTEAEMQCILNAIFAFKKQQWKGITKIIINTDSLNSIAIFKRDAKVIKRWGLKWGEYLANRYTEITKELPPIEFRHVKAHKTTENARSWVNDWCDKKAKEMLWKLINDKK